MVMSCSQEHIEYVALSDWQVEIKEYGCLDIKRPIT